MSGHGEQNRQLAQHLETVLFPAELSGEQHLLMDLLDSGFEWEEAIKLLRLRDHLYENAEMRQRIADASRDMLYCAVERCQSGRMCRSRKAVGCKPSWVRIPLSPPHPNPEESHSGLVSTTGNRVR